MKPSKRETPTQPLTPETPDKTDLVVRAVTATLEAPRLAAIGFAAELRRVTSEWHRRRSGARTLWGEPATDDPGPEGPPGPFPAPPA